MQKILDIGQAIGLLGCYDLIINSGDKENPELTERMETEF